MQLRKNRLSALNIMVSATLLSGIGSINLAPQAECKSSPASNNAKHVTLTGEYGLKLGRNESHLYVKEQAPGKIKFAVRSLWIGNAATGNVNTGQAGGVIELKDNKGSFKHSEGFTLNFAFMAGKCVVTCTDCSGFGGVNVDPDGTYKKVSSKVPSADDLEADR